jgi:hypothetical protein
MHELHAHRIEPGPTKSDGRGATIAIGIHGLRLELQVCQAGILDAVLGRLPLGWEVVHTDELDCQFRLDYLPQSESPVRVPGYHLFRNNTFTAMAHAPESAADLVENSVQMYIAEFARPQLFMHAGVVKWNGAAVVLPGSSMAGKSTLVAALVEAGATYFSDEYAVLDEDGLVSPYARPISLRQGPLGASRRELPHVRDPAAVGDRTPLPVSLVVLTRYVKGVAWNCDRLAQGEAILEMCKHMVAIQRRPAEAMAVLSKVADSAIVLRGSRGELPESVAAIRAMAFAGDRLRRES